MHGNAREALLLYGPAQFQVLRPGEYVLCARTRQAIPVVDLRYWSVERQEPYADARIALEAAQRTG